MSDGMKTGDFHPNTVIIPSLALKIRKALQEGRDWKEAYQEWLVEYRKIRKPRS